MSKEHFCFTSPLGPLMEEYLSVKRHQNVGIKAILTVFVELDRMPMVRRMKNVAITQEIYLKWLETIAISSERTRYAKILLFRQFSQFMCHVGYASYIPPLPKRPKTSYIPHIYSEQEVMSLFSAIDNTLLQCHHNTTCLIGLPVIFRFLYYCGARVGEVLAIKNSDVNLTEGFVTLTETKNRKHRLIPLNEQMKEILCTYMHYRDKMPLASSADPTSYLFVNHRGEKISHTAVYTRFREMLRLCGITHVGHGEGPRVHDLRHTFAVHSVYHMVKSGMDVYTAWPIISTLLGHHDIYSTEHYIRLALEVYPDLYQTIGDKLTTIFPDL